MASATTAPAKSRHRVREFLLELTAANYDEIRPGISKAQIESILGPPTTAETKNMVIFKKTTYRNEKGTKFILLIFKNEELESKDSNLTAQ